MYGCEGDQKIKQGAIVTISTDKTSIIADNKDKVFFTVTVDGNNITSPVVITEKNTNIPVEGMSFSTDSAATYTFYAVYDNIKSNEIRIDATDIEIKLSVDTKTIKANNKDHATFTVEADGEDVTSSATIIQVETQETVIAGSGFHTKIPGVYTFYATYDGKTSNEIQVNASAVVVSLSVDKSSIKADNWDKSTFTVKACDEDVTASAVITQLTKHSDKILENREFLTDEAGKYTFFATYEDVKSNEVNIEATSVNLAFLRGHAIFEVTSTACPVCMVMTEELEAFRQSRPPGRIHLVALHPSGKYCDSDLAGALAATAVSFVDNINTNYASPPWALVDIYNVVNIKINVLGEYVTQRYLTDALTNAANGRGGVSLTGMAVQSAVNGRKIEFEVGLKTKKTDNYRFFAFVVEDGVVNRQALGGAVDPNHIFNNVATYQLTEGDPFWGVSLGTIIVGNETTRSFSIDTGTFRTGRNVNLDNCRIVCYTLRSDDGRYYFIDNVTSCPVNGSVRYLYER